MKYCEWKATVPEEIKADSVWKSEAYRLGLFLADLAWHDATRLLSDKRTVSLSDQLYRSAGGISADIEEGYSRGTGRDRARFYEFALGSAREARGWYYQGPYVLTEVVGTHRIGLLTHIIKLLLAMIPDQRGQVLREDPVAYRATWELSDLSVNGDVRELLERVPMA